MEKYDTTHHNYIYKCFNNWCVFCANVLFCRNKMYNLDFIFLWTLLKCIFAFNVYIFHWKWSNMLISLMEFLCIGYKRNVWSWIMQIYRHAFADRHIDVILAENRQSLTENFVDSNSNRYGQISIVI